MFFAIPLRKFYIIKQKLVFPGSVAAAHILRSLHTGKNAEANAKKKVRALIIAFCLAITLRCTSEYAPGLMWDWHWGWTFYRLGYVFVYSQTRVISTNNCHRWSGMIGVENWQFVWEWTPAFIGTSPRSSTLSLVIQLVYNKFSPVSLIGSALHRVSDANSHGRSRYAQWTQRFVQLRRWYHSCMGCDRSRHRLSWESLRHPHLV